MYLKDTLGKEGTQELIGNLSKDRGQMAISISLNVMLPLLFDYPHLETSESLITPWLELDRGYLGQLVGIPIAIVMGKKPETKPN